jgi:predicted nucleic-acid-binding protein
MINILDTNAIIKYLLKDNVNQFKIVQDLMEKVRLGQEHAVILESVLTEYVYVLIKFYKIPGAEVADKLINLLNYRGIVNKDKEDFIFALKFFSANNLAIVDCIALTKAKKNKYKLFSFDKKLMKMFKQKSDII